MLLEHPEITRCIETGYPRVIVDNPEYRICPISGCELTERQDKLLFSVGISKEGIEMLYTDELGKEFVVSDTEEDIPDEEIKNYCMKNIQWFGEFLFEKLQNHEL